MKKEDEKKKASCGCDETCTCGDDCHCLGDDKCSENCTCGEECECEECHCEECGAHSESPPDKAEEYLNMARVIQADFDNYRKKSYEQILNAKIEGIAEAVNVILPALDSFKEAKKMIDDPKVLEGVEMIETKMLQSLKVLGIEKIEAVGKPFDHNLHSALATLRDDSLEDGIVMDEYQAGYKFKDKVLRYSQVVINKRED